MDPVPETSTTRRAGRTAGFTAGFAVGGTVGDDSGRHRHTTTSGEGEDTPVGDGQDDHGDAPPRGSGDSSDPYAPPREDRDHPFGPAQPSYGVGAGKPEERGHGRDPRDGREARGPEGEEKKPGDAGGRRALFWAIGGVAISFLAPPVGLVAILVALVLGIKAQRRASAAGEPAPGAVPAIIIGAVGAVVALVLTVVVLVFLPELLAYQDCMSGANTTIARNECRATLDDALRARIGLG